MSDAFRSQLEASEEKVRRADEQIATLEEQVTKLETQLSVTQKPGNLWVGGICIGLLSLMIGAGLGTALEYRARQSREARLHAEVAELEARRALGDVELQQCKQELASCRTPYAPPPLPPAQPPCNCQPGDPLCSCLDTPPGPAFDRGAAAAALGGVELKGCATETESRPLHATITFAPNGTVPVAVLDYGFDLLTEAERSCVLKRIKAVHVPPFGGAPVRVGKSFTLSK